MYISFEEVKELCLNEDSSFVGKQIHPEDLHLFIEDNGQLFLDSGDFDGEGLDGLVLDKNGFILYYNGYWFSTL